MKIATPKSAYIWLRTVDCVPVTGSTMRAEREADQRVEQRARGLHGGEHRAQRVGERQADDDLLEDQAAEAERVEVDRAVLDDRHDADGQRRRAMIARARPGTILLENSGASRKSGEIRARTRKNPATCCSEKRARSSLGSIRRRRA